MEKKTEQIHPDQWLKDLPNETEVQSFSAESMISCEKCGRKSPPTRLKCLYCGTELKISAEQTEHLKPALRKLEDWEKGFNVILESTANEAENLTRIADFLHLEKDDAQKILETKLSLPLARAETLTEAEVLLKKLEEFGVKSRIINDESLNTEKLPRRLRGLDFYEDRLILILFNADEIAEIPYQDLGLIVTGAYFERKIEATESLKKKDEKKILDSRELSSDEMLIDIYSRIDSIGYRIEAKGFDFSCLGDEKVLFAKDNMPKIVEKLRAVSPNTKFNSDYLKIREALGKVWNVSERSDSLGLARKGIGGLKRTNVTTVNNLHQFTRYSRLQWHLL
ncbi:MAG: hypothetical protein AAB336_09960 [Acidobacteriota bacterium]